MYHEVRSFFPFPLFFELHAYQAGLKLQTQTRAVCLDEEQSFNLRASTVHPFHAS
jgi:hypothetical protein